MATPIGSEKVIKGLECCAIPGGDCHRCPYDKYGIEGLECENKLVADALALLKADQTELIRQRDIIAQLQASLDLANGKLINMGYEAYNCDDGRDTLENCIKAAQEPRVMTLEEIDEDEAYWFEEKYGKKSLGRNVLIHNIEEDAREPYISLVYTFGEASYEISEYGQTWRLWSSKPTDEQREAVPWPS